MGSRARFILVYLSFLPILLLPDTSSAQFRAYCNIIKVKSTQLLNAVRVEIVADGTIDLDFDLDRFVDWEKFSIPGIPPEETMTASIRIPMKITNARTQVGNFADVSKYPISHVEISVPPESKDGIGIDVFIVFYVPAFPWSGEIRSLRKSLRWTLGPPPPGAIGVEIRTTPDQKGIIITALSDKYMIKEEAPRGIPVEQRKHQLRVSYEDGKLSVFSMNVDIATLLAAISEKTAIRLLLSGDISRNISMKLDDMSLDKFLDYLSTGYGLSIANIGEDKKVYIVSEGTVTGRVSYYASRTEIIPLKFIRAGVARDLLPDFLLKFVHLDEEKNALVVTGPDGMIKKIKRDVEKIDIPSPQIRIEAIVVEFKRSEDMSAFISAALGMDPWKIGYTPEFGEISISRIERAPAEILAKLDAFIDSGKAQIKAKPSLLISNGGEGKLFVGEQRMIQIIQYEGRVPTGKAIPVSIGTNMKARPWTGGEEINIRILVETSSILEIEPEKKLPTISSRKAETSVRVKDGEMIAIGIFGYSQKISMERGTGVPFLKGIPILSKKLSSSKMEDNIVIFLMPKVERKEE